MLEPQRRIASSPLDLPLFDDVDDPTDDIDGAAPQPWWRRRVVAAAIAVVVVIALIAGGIAVFAHPGQTSVTYTTGSVTTVNLTTTISATGPLAAGTYNVSASSGTKINEVDVTVGQVVTAGQTLAKLDPTSLQDIANQAQTQVNSAQTALNNAYVSRSNTQAQTSAQLNLAYLTQQTALSNCSTPPKGETVVQCQQTANAQYNQSVAQANQSNANADAQVSNAQSSLANAQAALTTAKDNLANATLTAPHAGTIAMVNGQAGGTVGSSSSSSGSAGSSAFIEIVDLTSMQITAGVNEADIGGVAPNQSATFTVSAYSSQSFRGTVTAVSPLGTSTSSVVTYPVTINVDMTRVGTAKLLPGMTASVIIATAQRAGVVLVPASAITFARTALAGGIITRTQLTAAVQQAAQQLASMRSSNPKLADDKPAASYVLERRNGKWTVVPIITGLTSGSVYEVLWGLDGGETVVTGQSGCTTTTTGTTSTGTGTGRGGFGGGGFGGGGFGGGGFGGGGGGTGG